MKSIEGRIGGQYRGHDIQGPVPGGRCGHRPSGAGSRCLRIFQVVYRNCAERSEVGKTGTDLFLSDGCCQQPPFLVL